MIDLFDPNVNNQLLNSSLILLRHAQVARGGKSMTPLPVSREIQSSDALLVEKALPLH